MKAPQHTVLFHPGAIGDTMLATPVAANLKRCFPGTRITYWSLESLRELIEMCPHIDEFQQFDKKVGLIGLTLELRRLQPDLFVNLSNSLRGKIFSLANPQARSLSYTRQSTTEKPVVHAVDNFLETISDICPDINPDVFPTIIPSSRVWEGAAETVEGAADLGEEPLIGLVPGVGNLRPHRGWPADRWAELIGELAEVTGTRAVLIGGTSERALAEGLIKRCKIDSEKKAPVNLAGKLSLAQTAALLARCRVVVSADTGPAHIAVAVGTPVIGLYGPTLVARSGPYGCLSMALDRNLSCQCIENKRFCSLTNSKLPGKCMEEISTGEILERLTDIAAI